LTFNKGSLILIDFIGKIKDTDKVFDTTIEQVAKESSIHDPHTIYQPKLVSIGEINYPVIKGLEEGLVNGTVGEKLTIEVAPDKGFGTRNPNKIRMIPLRKLGDDADKISVGDPIQIDNKNGIVQFIGSGRVKIDYNHKLAGKTLVYEATITKHLESDSDKIDAIMRNSISADDSTANFEIKDDNVTIEIPEKILNSPNLQDAKQLIKTDIFEFVPRLEKIIFTESHTNKKKSSTDASPNTELSSTTTPPPTQPSPQQQ
jgi:peptidylprolyl isomerase